MDDPATAAASERARSLMIDDWNFLTGLLTAGQAAGTPGERAKLPLTLLGGFLGAGKTTLVNHLLRHPAGRRLLVLVNDFGSINIDERLIIGRSSQTLSLSNGCVCCSLAGDLARKLREIVQADERPDAILLEASGLSDTNGLVYVVDTNAGIELNGVIVVLDAEQLTALAVDPLTADLVTRQIEGADVLILNKMDLLQPSGREATLPWLESRAAGRPILEATHAEVPAEVVLGVGHVARAPVDARTPAPSTHAFESTSLAARAPLDRARVTSLLRALPDCVLRAKGLLRFVDDPSRSQVFQRVGQRWSLTPGEVASLNNTSDLVLIYPRGALDANELARQFERCQPSPGNPPLSHATPSTTTHT